MLGGKPLQISARRLGTTTVFDVTGDIDLANSPEVRKALLTEIREKKTPKVVMNLSKVRYIDSSGVASLGGGIEGVAGCGDAIYAGGIESGGAGSVAAVEVAENF